MTMFGLMEKAKAALGGKSQFRVLADRIREIRGSGFAEDGLHTLAGLKISKDDYLLMGCDNSCAARNYPDVPQDERHEGRWFTGGDDLGPEQAGGNYHSTQRKDGTWEIESFYSPLPPAKYQSTPEEVAWHYLRVKELRAANIPQPDRVRMLKEEAADKPWETMR